MNTLYLIRGISGSGKTTLAKEMAEKLGCDFYEADQFFTQRDGSYTFNPQHLPHAHAACLENAMYDMRHFDKDVIVSNTFTRLWEMRQYIDFAIERGFKVHIITCTGKYQNVHGLSEEQIQKQMSRFQNHPQIAAVLKYDAARYSRIVYSYHGTN